MNALVLIHHSGQRFRKLCLLFNLTSLLLRIPCLIIPLPIFPKRILHIWHRVRDQFRTDPNWMASGLVTTIERLSIDLSEVRIWVSKFSFTLDQSIITRSAANSVINYLLPKSGSLIPKICEIAHSSGFWEAAAEAWYASVKCFLRWALCWWE